jgi:hypothetical protein
MASLHENDYAVNLKKYLFYENDVAGSEKRVRNSPRGRAHSVSVQGGYRDDVMRRWAGLIRSGQTKPAVSSRETAGSMSLTSGGGGLGDRLA